jgi:hypothetical protein
MRRRPAIVASAVRKIAGIVSVAQGRDRLTSETIYLVRHGGGDVAFQSLPIGDEDRAKEPAAVLAQFTGAQVQS